MVKTAEKKLKCPRCDVFMKKIKKGAVVIDVCTACRGMWLDDNEIEKLVHMGEKNEKK
ncbi:MAG: zf-TFIIB domain-containing protein [Candidatus Woesearchaeota archaeon]|nr:zf-TFIIB domain-containing protein [Candidatus Woesearchaeota archaeon]